MRQKDGRFEVIGIASEACDESGHGYGGLTSFVDVTLRRIRKWIADKICKREDEPCRNRLETAEADEVDLTALE